MALEMWSGMFLCFLPYCRQADGEKYAGCCGYSLLSLGSALAFHFLAVHPGNETPSMCPAGVLSYQHQITPTRSLLGTESCPDLNKTGPPMWRSGVQAFLGISA